jgi:hypothetical protein
MVCLPWLDAGSLPSHELGIVMDFQGPHSPESILQMQREAEEILKETGLHLEWLLPREAVEASHADLVVFQFRGTCVPNQNRVSNPEENKPAALAFTYETDGILQPFGEVSCDRVAASVHSALQPGDFSRGDLLLGRALGRVLAHELVHILTGSEAHGREGIGKSTLSAKELITASFPLSREDLARLRRIYAPASEASAQEFRQGGGRAMRLR